MSFLWSLSDGSSYHLRIFKLYPMICRLWGRTYEWYLSWYWHKDLIYFEKNLVRTMPTPWMCTSLVFPDYYICFRVVFLFDSQQTKLTLTAEENRIGRCKLDSVLPQKVNAWSGKTFTRDKYLEIVHCNLIPVLIALYSHTYIFQVTKCISNKTRQPLIMRPLFLLLSMRSFPVAWSGGGR